MVEESTRLATAARHELAALMREPELSAPGPTLPPSAVQQVGNYLTYTGGDANVVVKAARDPKRAWAKCGGVSEITTTLRPWGYSIGSSARGGDASRMKPIALMTFGSTTRLNLLELNRQVARPCCRAGCGWRR